MDTAKMLNSTPYLDLPPTRVRAKPVANIGRLLLEQGRMTEEKVEQVLRLQQVQNVRFGIAAQQLGLVTPADVEYALAKQFHYSYLVSGQDDFARGLVAAIDPFGATTELLRGVRSELIGFGFGGRRKTLAVAGIGDGEGNSLLAANLAVLFSQLSKRTLLIDANLRAERQQMIFKTNSGPGFADVLADRADTEVIVAIDQLPGLSLLSAGTIPPNPAELLGRGVFGELHALLAQKFDLIVIDTCGFAGSGEALPLASKIDGAVISVLRDRTSIRDIAVTGARLRQAGIELAGSVLLD